MRVVVVGSSNTDLVIETPRLPLPGETVLGGEFRQFAGGKGANQAVAAARAGAEVTFVGARGDDDFGRAAAALLKADGVNTKFFTVKAGVPSGVALIFVGGKQGENCIAVARSANDALSEADVLAAESAFRKADVIVAQLEVPLAAVMTAARLAAKHRVPFVLNPAPARKLPSSLLRLVHIIVPNRMEAAQIASGSALRSPIAGVPATFASRETAAIRSAQRLVAAGCANVALTLGANGVLLAGRTGLQWIKAPRVKPVDTVGAGDCFTAWLAVGLAEKLDVPSAAERACRAAAIAVTRRGAQAGMPRRAELLP
jgi:ribokinase